MSYDGPGTYQHYKGSQYIVLGLGVEEATLTPVVIYQPVNLKIPDDVLARANLDISYWTRPLDDLNSNVTVPGVRDTHPDLIVPRFKKLS